MGCKKKKPPVINCNVIHYATKSLIVDWVNLLRVWFLHPTIFIFTFSISFHKNIFEENAFKACIRPNENMSRKDFIVCIVYYIETKITLLSQFYITVNMFLLKFIKTIYMTQNNSKWLESYMNLFPYFSSISYDTFFLLFK